MQEVIVDIKSKITYTDGYAEKTELSTNGKYSKKNGNHYIVYDEPLEEGLPKLVTILRVDRDDHITMKRQGDNQTDLFIEKGKRHLCRYDMGMGYMTIGLETKNIETYFGESHGRIKFSYALDMNAENYSKNEIDIKFREAKDV